MHGHSNRVGAIAWNSTILSTGSRDKTILHRDLRSSSPFFSKLIDISNKFVGLNGLSMSNSCAPEAMITNY